MQHEVSRFDRLIGYFSPGAALRRASYRSALSAYYDGAKTTRLRKTHRTADIGPNAVVRGNAVAIRDEVRNLERNHDLARGVIRTLVNNIVGPNGIGIEPQPKKPNGEIHEEYRNALLEAWLDWCKRPEVTWRHSWSKTQRLMCKTWVRDGESFAQRLLGPVPKLDHGTRVPYSLELLEPDMIPWDQDDDRQRIIQGVRVNAWGRPTGYMVYKEAPESVTRTFLSGGLKEVPASRMLHLASIDRVGQVRGVSEFAAVITRLYDIKDYEESERIAAKVAASLTAYIQKGSAEAFNADIYLVDESGQRKPRELNLSPGMIIDDLLPGENVGMIDSNRPNPNVVTFRQGQLRAIAAGIGASYSSISRDYNGTYSAQRQELVEQWTNYATLTDEFVCDFVEPVWQDFVRVANITGVVPMPRDVNPESMADAMYVAQSMPWIDPMKEAEASVFLSKAGFASEYELIRKRGGSPDEVLKQIVKWREKVKAAGLILSSDAATEQPPAPVEKDDTADNAKASFFNDQSRASVDNLRAEVSRLSGLVDASSKQEKAIFVDARQVNDSTALAKSFDGLAQVVAAKDPPQPINVGPINIDVQVPEQEAPVVNVANQVDVPGVSVNVEPANVVVSHPSKSVQVVERNSDGTIDKTVTTYESK